MNYNLLSKEAVINYPPGSASNPYSMISYFDIERLYWISDNDILRELRFWEREIGSPTITKDRIGEIDCIRMEYCLNRIAKGDNERIEKANVTFWFAPDLSYSLIRKQAFRNNIESADKLTLLYEYEAAYEESEHYKGIWLLKDLRIVDKDGPFSEQLTVTLKETKIGVHIPDETFTFKGLGVPPGTPVYDRTSGRNVLLYYYKLHPTEETGDR